MAYACVVLYQSLIFSVGKLHFQMISQEPIAFLQGETGMGIREGRCRNVLRVMIVCGVILLLAGYRSGIKSEVNQAGGNRHIDLLAIIDF